MARTHGKDSNFSFNGVAIEDELNSITMTASVAESDITAFGDAYQNFLAGKKDISFDVTGALDMDFASDGDATIFDHIALTSGPMVSSYSISLPVGDAATYTATFQCSGSTTRAVS
jgi:hypothetical protein